MWVTGNRSMIIAMRVTTYVLLTGIAAIVCGCATPRYQTFYRYDLPNDRAGRECVAQCDQDQKTCADNCTTLYKACVRDIEPEAKSRYADALKRYQGQWEQYQQDLDRYHLSLSLGWGHYNGWYGEGWYDPWSPYGGYRPYYFPPEPPQPPVYADELIKLSAEKCNHACGCQSDYDACFLSCGGRKVPEQRCIVNCPPPP